MKVELIVEDILIKRPSVESVFKKEVTGKLAYRLSKIADKFVSQVKQIEEKRLELYKKYGFERKEQPGSYELDPEKKVHYTEEWDKYLDTPVTLDIHPIPWEFLDQIKISPADTMHLACFIEDEPKEDAGK